MFIIEDWLGSLVPGRGTSKGDIVIASTLIFLVLFTAPQLLWLLSVVTFTTTCRFVFIGVKWNVFLSGRPHYTSFEGRIRLVIKASVETGSSATKDRAQGKCEKAELKCLIPDYLVEEDLISNDELDSVSSKVEVSWVELKHNTREQEKQRECQMK